MKSIEFLKLIEPNAPMAYSKEFCSRYGAYDNSGLLIDCGGEINGAVFALDLSEGAVEFAKERGAQAIVTHHPAIYNKIASLSVSNGIGGAILAAAGANLSVISMHLNLDAAEGGIDETLALGVRAAANRAANGERTQSIRQMQEKKMYSFTCGGGGYGRAYDLLSGGGAVCAAKLKEEIDRELCGKHTLLYAREGQKVRRAASFCGAGADEESIAFAIEQGADVLISSDIKHHVIKEAVLRGLAIIAPTHYAAENYGFYQFYSKLQKIVKAVGVRAYYYENAELL